MPHDLILRHFRQSGIMGAHVCNAQSRLKGHLHVAFWQRIPFVGREVSKMVEPSAIHKSYFFLSMAANCSAITPFRIRMFLQKVLNSPWHS
jgi:hypothetical protein